MISSFTAWLLVLWPRLQTRAYSFLISGLFAEFGPGCRVSPPFRFANLRQVRLGREVIINRDCWIHVVPKTGDDQSVKLDIGPYCGIGMGATISAAASIVVEDHVLLARNVYISDHRHTYEGISSPIMHQGVGEVAPVFIGRGTWLGQNVVVLPGVTIGEHCVVGANSVVRSSIPAFSVAVGAPARVVRHLNRETGEWEKLPQAPTDTPR